jgi:hypothetical protein
MFDLEKEIAKWRENVAQAGVQRLEVLDELESHLRDDVGEQIRSGIEPERAFEAAAERIGRAGALETEFKKVGGLKEAQNRVRQTLLTFAGVPNHYLDTAMNTPDSNPFIEPRWATYLKAAAYIAPAVCLWCLSLIYVVPEVVFLSRHASRTALPELMRENLGFSNFIKDNLLVLAGLGILALILLEWRAKVWPRYRRATLGLAAFLLNFTFLISLFLFFVAAVLVAVGLTQPVK